MVMEMKFLEVKGVKNNECLAVGWGKVRGKKSEGEVRVPGN